MIYIETVQKLEDSIHILSGHGILGLDIESTGLNAIQNRLRLIQIGTPQEVLVIDVFKVGLEVVKKHLKSILEDKSIIKILHNAKFDVKFIKYHLGIDVERIFDSYLASLLINGGLAYIKGVKIPKGYHGLEQVLKRYTGIELDKTEQKSDWSGVLTESQIKYAADDVYPLFPLREAMIKKLQELKLIRCAKLEFETILPTAWLELSGFYLNFEPWVALANAEKERSFEIQALIFEELKDVVDQGSLFGELNINLGSHQQVQKYFRAYGIPMPDSTQEFFLTPLIEEYPLIEKFIEYKGCNKAYTAFGENWKEKADPTTGRIHADYKQIGAEATGRYSTSKPNLAQIPADEAHRSCFQAEGDNVLVIADFSQEELRLLADFSGDKLFRQAFKDGDDFHAVTASQIFKISLDEVAKDKETRNLAKRMNFLLTYGGGASKFSMSAGIPLSEAEGIIRQYFSTYKGVKRWLDYQKSKVLNTRCARSLSGRIANYDFDINDGKVRSHVQRMAANMPLQGSGADILKRAMRLLYDKTKPYHPHIKLVNIVHDELIVESTQDLALTAQQFLEASMKEAWYESVKSVDIKIDIHVSKVWQK